MTEAFLHYLWQYRLFDTRHLKTPDGVTVEIVRPGEYNTGSGPDFFQARLRLDGTLWVGNVEIHMHASDWQRHGHHHDPAYDNCILHVVYDNDSPTLRGNGTTIPVVELKQRFKPYLWDNYLRLIGNRGWIPCQHRIHEIDPATWKVIIEKMIVERLRQKSGQVLQSLQGLKGDWEKCFYQALARNFGFRLNALPFEMVARSLPLKCIAKERSSLHHVEALLFGQAGMLGETFHEAYPAKLKETYLHLAKKYALKNIPYSAWKFLRLRPVNFPAVRLAQFAALLVSEPNPFRTFSEVDGLATAEKFTAIQASDYWNTHYHFGRISAHLPKRLGISSVHNLLINTIAPFLYAQSVHTGDKSKAERALKLLQSLPPEANHLIDRWKETGVKVYSAVDTQALIQLKMQHCSEKKCLTCNIGNRLINHLP